MRYGLLAALLAATFILEAVNASPARAWRYCIYGGYCPTGTCLKYNPIRRVQYACNVANCRAANCPR
jgi:hypothetical protein